MIVRVRGKRSRFESEVEIAELLPHSVDGPGFLDTDGDEFRRFYYDLSLVSTADGEPVPGARAPRALREYEVARTDRRVRTYRVQASSKADAVSRVERGLVEEPTSSRDEAVAFKVRAAED